uniref:Uncharacterized protein n=1 Tax=Lepeophtheirus salmonis TaxID=72036 RepID=A0A0K2U9R6_LEPSM
MKDNTKLNVIFILT